MITAAEAVVPPIQAQSGLNFFIDRSWEVASLAFSGTFSSGPISRPSFVAASLPAGIGFLP